MWGNFISASVTPNMMRRSCLKFQQEQPFGKVPIVRCLTECKTTTTSWEVQIIEQETLEDSGGAARYEEQN